MTDQHYAPNLGKTESARVVMGLHDDPALLAKVLQGREVLPEVVPIQEEQAVIEDSGRSSGVTPQDVRAARKEIGEVVRDIKPVHGAHSLEFGSNIMRYTAPPAPRDYVKEDKLRRQVAATERKLHSIPGEPLRLARRR